MDRVSLIKKLSKRNFIDNDSLKNKVLGIDLQESLRVNEESNLNLLVFKKSIGILNKKGKRKFGEKVLYLNLLKLKYYNSESIEPLFFYYKGLLNGLMLVEIINKKRGGTYYKLPVYLNEKRGLFFCIRELYKLAVVSRGLEEGFFKEVINLVENQGVLVQKKKERHSLAEKNRVYLEFLK